MTEWSETTLGAFAPLTYGKALPSAQRDHDGGVPVYGSNGQVGRHDEPFVNEAGVIIGRKGSVGEVHYSPGPFWPIDTSFYVIASANRDIRFTYYLLRHLKLSSLSGDSAVPGLNRDNAHAVLLRVPSLQTQHGIAAVLGAIDDLIENNRRRIELLEQMAQAIYREWFVNFRYPGHETATFVDSPLGPMPENWEIRRASDAVAINPRTQSRSGVGDPFITMSDLDNEGMVCFPSALKDGTAGSKFLNADTLFARITPCLENGKTGFVQCLADNQVGRGSTEFIVLRGAKVGPAFTYFLARQDDFRRHAIASMSGASGRQRVRNECFDSYELPLATPDILLAFEESAIPMMEHAFSLAKRNRSLAALRDLLLPKLVTGEIDVSQLDLGALVGAAS